MLPLLWGSIFVASKRGTIEHINVGFGEVHDLREVFKGEEEAVALLLY